MSWTNEFLRIQPNNEALKFLDRRLKDECYRGIHISQHNRFDLNDVTTILRILDQMAPEKSKMQIRTTDLSKRPKLKEGEMLYAEFCDKVHHELGRGSQDSIRKNLFVDFHRMGIISRYDKKGNEIDPYDRTSVKFVSLNNLGMKLIKRSVTDRYFIYSKGLNNLFEDRINMILELLTNPDYDLKFISIEEYQFFVTAIKTDTNFSVKEYKAVELIKEYRKLSRVQRNALNESLKNDLKPNKKYSKNKQRDYGNWLNESEQTFHLLKQTIYFDVVNKRLKLISNTDKDSDLPKLLRSDSQKKRYFIEHGISKRLGFELHHVVPLLDSESEHHFKTLDRWENMVYIDALSHAKITQNKSRNVIMTSNNNDLTLNDYCDNQVYLRNQKNILYDSNNQKMMLEYNLTLRER